MAFPLDAAQLAAQLAYDAAQRFKELCEGGAEAQEAYDSLFSGQKRSREVDEGCDAGTSGKRTRLEAVVRDVMGQFMTPEVEPWPEGLSDFRHGRLLTTPRGSSTSIFADSSLMGCFVRKKSMLSGAFSAFFIQDAYFSRFLPVKGSGPHASRNLFVGREITYDPLLPRALAALKLQKVLKGDFDRVADELKKLHKTRNGENYEACYAYAAGSSHSKVMAIRYQGCLLIVITSANFMLYDWECADNHHYVQAFPELPTPIDPSSATPNERDFLEHLSSIGFPPSVISSIAGRYDWTLAQGRINIVASTPGTKSGPGAEEYGLLRLNALARKLLSPELKKDNIKLEICTGSVGKLNEEWIKTADWMLKGKSVEELAEKLKKDEVKRLKMPDDWTVVYPSSATVNACSDEAKAGATNLSCGLRSDNWPTTPSSIRSLFHDYTSKTPGRLFHQKLILWHDKGEATSSPSASSSSCSANPSASTSPKPPLLMYIGSHNLSALAWGTVEVNKRGEHTGTAKLTSCYNFELGVVIKGEGIESMLEPGGSWEDVITYVQPARQYGPEEKPWNAPPPR
ncbi:hypothetical protein JCM10213v2_009036 [Rhodosporidiobolus nylandii]